VGALGIFSSKKLAGNSSAGPPNLGNKKATATQIAAINDDVMTTATMMTIGARQRCSRTQEHSRGSGVAPDPDKWLTMRTVSAGSGHGAILLGKSEVNRVNLETY
jgi:hypothetical protein